LWSPNADAYTPFIAAKSSMDFKNTCRVNLSNREEKEIK
jgi:hypothetical protein